MSARAKSENGVCAGLPVPGPKVEGSGETVHNDELLICRGAIMAPLFFTGLAREFEQGPVFRGFAALVALPAAC